MSSEHTPAQSYADYLDKESTLVGLLATFAIAASALLLQATLGAKESTTAADLWHKGGGYIASSAAFCVIAAVAFFRQRSLLAYYVGQLAIARALGSAPAEWKSDKPLTVNELILKANEWSTWFWYQAGWVFLTSAAAALLAAFVTIQLPCISSPLWQASVNIVVALCALGIVVERYRSLRILDKK